MPDARPTGQLVERERAEARRSATPHPQGLPARDLTPSSLDGSEAHPSEPHKEEDIGLEEIGDAVSNVVYDNIVLGRIDLQVGKITGSENV